MDLNESAFQNPELAQFYGPRVSLYGAEKMFLAENNRAISTFQMLDVGIGVGRTTRFFAPLVANYLGIDFSPHMIEFCRNHFHGLSSCIFNKMDARDLSSIVSKSFDLVLFSFNGIDYATLEERNRILQEFHRILKGRGHLLFSFHNALNLGRLYAFQFPRNPRYILWEFRRLRRLKSLNGPATKYRNIPMFYLHDGADNFQTRICYMHPEMQRNLLIDCGFCDLEFSVLTSGKKLSRDALIKSSTPWVSVHARKS